MRGVWPFAGRQAGPPVAPPGTRTYVIGDVHGEAALFARLMAAIRRDNSARAAAETAIVLLGDVIDRGPRSADLLHALIAAEGNAGLVVLKGNHEAALVDAWRGDEGALGFWLTYGGVATLASFGAVVDVDDLPAAMATLRAAVPEAVIDWLDELPLSHEVGDYLLVHAGVRPGVRLARQAPGDLLWIREPFLSSRRDHGKVIVHGHTVTRDPVALGGNRIGIDTGAGEGGPLTALGLQDEMQWLLSVDPA